MEDWTSLGQHKRKPEFPVVTREIPPHLEKNHVIPPSSQDEALALYSAERMQVLWFDFLYSQVFLISKVIALLITQTFLQCVSSLDKPFGDGTSVNSFIYPRTYKL